MKFIFDVISTSYADKLLSNPMDSESDSEAQHFDYRDYRSTGLRAKFLQAFQTLHEKIYGKCMIQIFWDESSMMLKITGTIYEYDSLEFTTCSRLQR